MPSMLQTGEPIGRRDLAIAAVLSVLGLILIYSDAVDPKISASYLAIPAFLAVTVPLVWRRSAPLLALGVVLLALAAHVLVFGEMTRCGIVFPLTWILVFAAAARLERGPALAGLLLGFGCIAVMGSADHQVPFGEIPPFLVLTVLVWGAGRVVRSRNRVAVDLQESTEQLRALRDERARLEVATDRERLS